MVRKPRVLPPVVAAPAAEVVVVGLAVHEARRDREDRAVELHGEHAARRGKRSRPLRGVGLRQRERAAFGLGHVDEHPALREARAPPRRGSRARRGVIGCIRGHRRQAPLPRCKVVGLRAGDGDAQRVARVRRCATHRVRVGAREAVAIDAAAEGAQDERIRKRRLERKQPLVLERERHDRRLVAVVPRDRVGRLPK